MALESRKGGTYYYKKERIGRRVVSCYLGNGPTARLIAQIEHARLEQAQLERAQRAAEQAELAELTRTPPELAELLAAARTATAAALQAAGYHQHKRQWRKKRESKERPDRWPND